MCAVAKMLGDADLTTRLRPALGRFTKQADSILYTELGEVSASGQFDSRVKVHGRDWVAYVH